MSNEQRKKITKKKEKKEKRKYKNDFASVLFRSIKKRITFFLKHP